MTRFNRPYPSRCTSADVEHEGDSLELTQGACRATARRRARACARVSPLVEQRSLSDDVLVGLSVAVDDDKRRPASALGVGYQRQAVAGRTSLVAGEHRRELRRSLRLRLELVAQQLALVEPTDEHEPLAIFGAIPRGDGRESRTT